MQTGESEFDVFERAGLTPVGEASGIRDGCVKLFNLIADPELPLLVSEACPWLIESIATVRPDKGKPDLYDQREGSPYQHVLDALRYWAVNDSSFDFEEWDPSDAMVGPAAGMWGRKW